MSSLMDCCISVSSYGTNFIPHSARAEIYTTSRCGEPGLGEGLSTLALPAPCSLPLPLPLYGESLRPPQEEVPPGPAWGPLPRPLLLPGPATPAPAAYAPLPDPVPPQFFGSDFVLSYFQGVFFLMVGFKWSLHFNPGSLSSSPPYFNLYFDWKLPNSRLN